MAMAKETALASLTASAALMGSATASDVVAAADADAVVITAVIITVAPHGQAVAEVITMIVAAVTTATVTECSAVAADHSPALASHSEVLLTPCLAIQPVSRTACLLTQPNTPIVIITISVDLSTHRDPFPWAPIAQLKELPSPSTVTRLISSSSRAVTTRKQGAMALRSAAEAVTIITMTSEAVTTIMTITASAAATATALTTPTTPTKAHAVPAAAP